MRHIPTLLLAAAWTAAWEFPNVVLMPQGGGQRPLSLADDDGEVDIVTGSQFNGLTTFANLPYVNCFADSGAKDQQYDIAILGAPFDTACALPIRPSGLDLTSNSP